MNNEEISSIIEKLANHLKGTNDTSEEQLKGLLDGDLDGPFHFVNLLTFRDQAAYPAGHDLADQPATGVEAYDRYGAVALEHVTRRGGRLVTLNDVERTLIGSTPAWHRVATMEYANVGAFIEMVIDPDYQAALIHRDAGLQTTEVFVTRPLITQPIG